MRKIAVLIASISIAANLFSQAPNKNLKSYSIVPILVNMIDTNLTMIKGSVELNQTVRTCELESVNLTSSNLTYDVEIDSSFRFRFGYIEPGNLDAIKLGSNKVKKERNIEKHDSINLVNGGVYELKILNGQGARDSCCVIGSSFAIPIYFDLMKADLDSFDQVILQGTYETIKKYNLKVEIGVHFDQGFLHGKESTCLSCKRANVIRNHLISLGINSKSITAKGYEATQPFFLNAKTDDQRQYNYRIVVKVIE